MEKIKLRQGAARRIVSQIRKEVDGGFANVVGLFDGDEELSAFIWPGDDRERTAALPCGWVDAPNGLAYADVDATTSAALAVGWYKGVVQQVATAWDLAYFEFEVEPGPGSATAPRAYHTYKDLTDELPWVRELADKSQDQGGFAEIAAEAKQWIDAAILRSVPSQNWPWLGCGLGSGYGAWGGGGACGSTGQAEDPTIAAALDAGRLVITTATGRRFVRASVYYTLGKILTRAVGMDGPDRLVAMAEEYERKAKATLASCTAEIDADGDGSPEYAFDLGRVQVRRA